MADRKPLKVLPDGGGDSAGLAEFVAADTVGIADGGTSATTAGAALTALGASPLAGSSSVTTLGTIGTGTWEATDVAVAHGGTGASDASTARSNLGITDTTPGGSNTHIQYNNGGAFGGSANLAWTDGTSTFAVAGTANAKMLNISASGAALGSQDASKIILVDLNDPATMWDVQKFLARARFTSWYQELGAPPMRGAIFINNAGTSLIWWTLDTDASYMSFTPGSANIMRTGSVGSDVVFLDGFIYVADAGDSSGRQANTIDLLSDKAWSFSTGGQNVFDKDLENRNNGTNGYVGTRSSLAIVDNTVNGVAVGRDASLTDVFGRPRHWVMWSTDEGASGHQSSMYNPINDAIYYPSSGAWGYIATSAGNVCFWRIGYPSNAIPDAARGNYFTSATANAFTSDFYLDQVAPIDGHYLGNDGASTITDLALSIGPIGYVLATAMEEGLGFTFLNEPDDNLSGHIFTTSTYQTPYMKGIRVAAYPLNDVNDRSGNGHTLTNNNTVTFASGGPTGSYANLVAASSQSLTLADHADFTGMTELSLSCWFKRDIDSGGNEGLINKSDTGTAADRSFGLYIGGGDVIEFFTRTGAQVSCYDHGITIALAQWYHVVGTYDGANMKLYLNGTLIHTAAQTGTITDSGEIFVIGARTSADSPQHFFDGQIAGVYVGATAMTESEVKLEHQRGVRVLGGATTKLANTDVKSVRVDQNTGLAAVTTAANQTEIWDLEMGLRQSIDATTTATIADADVRLKTGATLPEYITARSGAIEFDGQTRSVI